MLFVGSFEFFSIFLLALIGGLVWEVFTVVSQSLKQEEDKISQLENDISQQQENNNNHAAKHDKKKKLILNDDNPDELRFHRKFRNDKVSKTHAKLNNIQPGYDDDVINEERPELNMSQPGSRSYFLYYGGSGKRLVPFQSTKFNIQKTDVCEHFLKNFISAEMWLQKKQVEGLDINKVAIDYMIHLRSEIKKDEMFQKKNFNISNHHLLIQNAVLRDASEVYIKQQEDKFFKTSFGQKFERIQELKFQIKLYSHYTEIQEQNIQPHKLNCNGNTEIPKSKSEKITSPINYSLIILFLNLFIKSIINGILQYIRQSLQQFQFKHQFNCISIEEGQIYFFKVGNGPWDYTDELFSEGNIRICENLSTLLESGNQECLRSIELFSNSVKSIAKNFEISLPSVDINNSCILYQIKNEKNIPNDIQSFKIKKSNLTSDDQSPNNQQYVYLDSQNQFNGFLKLNQSPKIETSNLDEQKNVNQTLLFVIARTTAQEQRIKYQNITMLIQFMQDMGSVIQNYSSTFFKQINNLYDLRYQDKIKSLRKL